MVETIMPMFFRHPKEAEIIGRLLAGYGHLEFDMCLAVSNVRADLDMAVKALYRPIGEGVRIDLADAIGRTPFRNLGLEKHFSMAIGEMRHCRKIRNQFAHCQWHDDYTGTLGFVNLQEVANENEIIDFTDLTTYHLSVPLLEAQEAFFNYVQRMFWYLNYEANQKVRKTSSPTATKPQQVQRPPLHIQ